MNKNDIVDVYVTPMFVWIICSLCIFNSGTDEYCHNHFANCCFKVDISCF